MSEKSGKNGAIIKILPADQEILRRLAGAKAELARRPVEAEKRELWCRHNALEATRPVFFCDPDHVVNWCRIAREEAAAA